jgi:hypothetical protein
VRRAAANLLEHVELRAGDDHAVTLRPVREGVGGAAELFVEDPPPLEVRVPHHPAEHAAPVAADPVHEHAHERPLGLLRLRVGGLAFELSQSD